MLEYDHSIVGYQYISSLWMELEWHKAGEEEEKAGKAWVVGETGMAGQWWGGGKCAWIH